MDSPILSVQQFGKSYDGHVAVTDLSFSVYSGQILGVIGPNGAGKTTTMRAISGILPATSGELSVCGLNVEDHPVEVKRQLAYVPDDPQLFHQLTVADHLAFTASVYGLSNSDAMAEKLLHDFQLYEKRNTPAKDLSRGMRQKLAICCAWLYDPKAMLFDEPLTGLDPSGIRTLKQSIRHKADSGSAVLISSHLLAMVEDICTHILMLNEGKAAFFGTTQQLKDQFQNQQGSISLEDIFFLATEGRSAEDAEYAEQHDGPSFAMTAK
ncbi:MAG: ABC transporter ATP-binding protein [Fuerstiella sp.]